MIYRIKVSEETCVFILKTKSLFGTCRVCDKHNERFELEPASEFEISNTVRVGCFDAKNILTSPMIIFLAADVHIKLKSTSMIAAVPSIVVGQWPFVIAGHPLNMHNVL